MTGYELRGTDGGWIASIHGEHCKISVEACEGNARLIVAAPKLLKALQKARETIQALHGDEAWDLYEEHSPEMRQIDTAIRAATGGA